MKNGRLIIALITSLLDEVLIIGVLIWGLPRLGIIIPVPVVVIVVLLFALYATVTFKLGSRILRMKPLAGLTDFKGVTGQVVRTLNPKGLIKIEGELWEARSLDGTIETGKDVVVVNQTGLKFEVKIKHKEKAD
jgi:membrane-bound ClpP family serine protease